jgi:PQQ-dependent catabolism-associated CXXCW motif protein
MQLLNSIFKLRLYFTAAMALVTVTGAGPAGVPEPEGYWMGPMHGEVPATLSGARVLDTEALAALLEQSEPVLIDAADMPRRPENLAPGAIWKPLPHESIARSTWIPGIGAGNIAPGIESLYRESLTRLTSGDPNRQIVFYCHPMCWASWNAAKRALSYGYRNVAWYPKGGEGWRDAGHTLVITEPKTPPPETGQRAAE